jgi:hypothetical protein
MSRDRSNLPPDRLLQPTTVKWFAVIFGVSLAYAILRYFIAGDVAWRHFPLFILNKVTSLAAVGFVACSYLVGKIFRWHDHDKVLRLVVIKFCGLMGFFLAAIHAFMSFFLLTPAYFGKYFDDGGRHPGTVFSAVTGDHDAADDAEGTWWMALETNPACGLHRAGPRCRPPRVPRVEGLDDTGQVAIGLGADQSRGARVGADSAGCQTSTRAGERGEAMMIQGFPPIHCHSLEVSC